jgi:hypothetical protein
MTTEQRFWNKVDMAGECWLWTASKRHKGYGAFSYTREGKMIQDRAHRYSWEIHNGAIPVGLCVLHNCPDGDNPACVNPAHLFLGTKADNNSDMSQKGRNSRTRKKVTDGSKYKCGNQHHGFKFSDAEIQLMRERRTQGWSFGRISKEHGISIGYAFRIIEGVARRPR